MKQKFIVLTLFIFVATLSLANMETSDAASPLYVNGTSGSDSHDGTSWENAKQTIQNPIDAVDSPGTVNVADEPIRNI